LTTYRLSNLDAELHEGDEGTEIVVTLYDVTEVDGELVQTVLDLTGITVTLLLTRRAGTIERATVVSGLAAAGTVVATLQAGDLRAGALEIRAKVVSDAGTWYTASVVVAVHSVRLPPAD
jgi:hypothetical protein